MQKTKMKEGDLAALLVSWNEKKLYFFIEGDEVRVIESVDFSGPAHSQCLATWDPQELLVQALQKLGVYAEIV